MMRPRAIAEGSRIGIISPARGIPPEALEQCVETVKSLGFVASVGNHAHERTGYFAGPHANRAADLMAMFADPRIDAIWCTHGGFGAERLYSLLDFATIRRNPKLFIGHSNIDQIHYMIHKHAFPWTVCFHNLTEVARMDAADARTPMECFRKITRGSGVPWAMPITDLAPPVEPLVPGVVRAPICGGCEINYCLATPWEVEFSGKLVVLDVSNENGFWSKWLSQLHSSGKLAQAAGFIVVAQTYGDAIPDWGRVRLRADANGRQTLRDYLDEFIAPLCKPTLMNVPMEHSRGALPIPYGAMVELDADRKTLTVLEDIVSHLAQAI
jgi:muramoyltetrapeptide carboxypeptidase